MMCTVLQLDFSGVNLLFVFGQATGRHLKVMEGLEEDTEIIK